MPFVEVGEEDASGIPAVDIWPSAAQVASEFRVWQQRGGDDGLEGDGAERHNVILSAYESAQEGTPLGASQSEVVLWAQRRRRRHLASAPRICSPAWIMRSASSASPPKRRRVALHRTPADAGVALDGVCGALFRRYASQQLRDLEAVGRIARRLMRSFFGNGTDLAQARTTKWPQPSGPFQPRRSRRLARRAQRRAGRHAPRPAGARHRRRLLARDRRANQLVEGEQLIRLIL